MPFGPILSLFILCNHYIPAVSARQLKAYQFPHLVEFLCMRCLPEGICYKIYIVYREFITILIIGLLNFTIIATSTFSGAFDSEIQ